MKKKYEDPNSSGDTVNLRVLCNLIYAEHFELLLKNNDFGR